MPFLLDTCTLWWLANKANHPYLSPRVVSLLRDNPDDLFISAISGFEFGVLFAKGRFTLNQPLTSEEWFREALKSYGISQVPINFQITTKSTQLPPLHTDPCDRIIIATAQEYSMQILTPDKLIQQYPEAKCVW